MSELRFDGRSAIVTGAGRGVGRAHAMLLAERGAKVVVADLGGKLDGSGSSSAPADEVVQEIQAAGGEAVACAASVADEAGAASIVQTALDTFGGIDIVVNNAGIAEPDWFEDLSIERFRRMVDVHYMGTVNVTFAAWPHMVKAGYGRIVNTCSEAMLGMSPKNTSYGGAKGGVFGFTRNARARRGPLRDPSQRRGSPREHAARRVRRSWRTSTTFPKRYSPRETRWRSSGRSSSRRRLRSSPTSRANSTAKCSWPAPGR